MQRTHASYRNSLSSILVVLILLQWFLFVSVLYHQHSDEVNRLHIHNRVFSVGGSAQNSNRTNQGITTITTYSENGKEYYFGVAMTVMLKAPRWFHRRYTVMLHNAMAIIPSTWPVQILFNDVWMQEEVFPLHPGLRRLRNHSRIIWTPLPTELTQKKPKELMKTQWLWNKVVAENVLIFSGNGAFCANSKIKVLDFVNYDYVGVPWEKHNGNGGDGSSHSFRHKSAMIDILKRHSPILEMDNPDFHYFVKYLLQDAEEYQYRIAKKATTYEFGGFTDPSFAPVVVAGTQPQLNWTSRDALLNVCPELKVIFPSLHEPSCFGAHPNGKKCKASICALQETLPASGC